MATVVKGVFHGKKRLTRAVERLAENSVPADVIAVHVLDPSGNPAREVPVEDESGALKGAILGAVAGAGVGLLILVLVLSGALGRVGVDLLDPRSIFGALRTVVAAAAAGVPLGALLGLGRWRGRKKISDEDLERGSGATVTVKSDSLAETARRVLRESGAEGVTG